MRITILLLSSIALLGCDQSSFSTNGQVQANLNLQAKRTVWSSPTSSGWQIDTPHYRIYTTCQNEVLLAALPGFMEAAYQNYLQLTGLKDQPLDPLVMYILGTRKEWETLTISRFGEHAAVLSIEAGGYCTDRVCVLYDIGGLGTLATASHEGMHQFLANRLKQSLPMWLEEGICSLCEGYQIYRDRVTFTPNENPQRYSALRRVLMRDLWLPMPKLLPMDAGDAVIRPIDEAVGYYGQLWALSLMLRTDKNYRDGLERLMRDAQMGKLDIGPEGARLAATGQRGRAYNRAIGEPVFRHYINPDPAAFDVQYKAFAKKLAVER